MPDNITYTKIKLDKSNLALSRKFYIQVTDIELLELDDEDRVDGPFHYGLELHYKSLGDDEIHDLYTPVNHPIKIRDGFDAMFLVKWVRAAIMDGDE